ncbi:MAG: Gfo/Idh/MocA family oxidoreductase, partial [Clostridia bacterium]|nr:Gfo/Idh/MocA family oxidoreductase [Clostridia bacterium]
MSKIKFGIFGLGRGKSFIHELRHMDDADLTAIFDKDPKKIEEALELCDVKPRVCNSYDELLDSGIDAVILCNYFHEHAPYAIRAFERGVAVFSECTSASTLKQCAELCDAYEKYNGKYMLAENYPFTNSMLAIEKKCREGKFGRILYAEGEYNHTGTYETLKELTPFPYHWRAYLARTYYSTHSLGPL